MHVMYLNPHLYLKFQIIKYVAPAKINPVNSKFKIIKNSISQFHIKIGWTETFIFICE